MICKDKWGGILVIILVVLTLFSTTPILAITLNNFDFETPEFCINNETLIKIYPYDLNNSLTDITNGSLKINTSYKATDIFKKNQTYGFLITFYNETETNLTIRLEDSGKYLEKTKKIKVVDCSKLDNLKERIKNLEKLIKENWEYLTIGVIVLIMLISLLWMMSKIK